MMFHMCYIWWRTSCKTWFSWPTEWFGARVDRTRVNFLVIYWPWLGWSLVSTALGSLEVFWAERGIRVITTITQACQQMLGVTNQRPALQVLTNQKPGEPRFWRRDALTGAGSNHNFKPLMFMTARPIFCFWIHNLGIFIWIILHTLSYPANMIEEQNYAACIRWCSLWDVLWR